MVYILKEINDLMENTNTIIFHIEVDKLPNKQVYVACFNNNRLTITSNKNNYHIITKYIFFSFLGKLKAKCIKKYDETEYIICCDYFKSKVSIIQRLWRKHYLRGARIRNDLVIHGLAEYWFHPSRISFDL